MKELQDLEKEWQEFKLALFKNLKLDKFIQWLSKYIK